MTYFTIVVFSIALLNLAQAIIHKKRTTLGKRSWSNS